MQTYEDTIPAHLNAHNACTVREERSSFGGKVLDAGHDPKQARLAAAHFEAARDEWVWSEATSGTERR